MSHVVTRWHQLCDAVREHRVRTFTSAKENVLPFAAANNVRLDVLESCIDFMSFLPRFIIEEKVLALVRTDQSLFSISDMITCDVLRLPYRECVIEYDYHSVMYSVLLRESDLPDGSREWECSLFGYRGRSLNDDAALIFPCAACLKVEGTDGDVFDTDVSTPKYPIIDYSTKHASFFNLTKDNESLFGDSHYFVFERCVTAFLSAMILPRTIGLYKQFIETKKSFNKSREFKGKSIIPNYTYIRLDRERKMPDINGAERESVAVHLRRAHKRRIAVGEGRAGRVWRFFPPQVVGYLPDGRKPSVPEILATRAARPYLLR